MRGSARFVETPLTPRAAYFREMGARAWPCEGSPGGTAMATRVDRPVPGAAEREPATRWTQLDAELRMLCRSLGHAEGWSPAAVTTFVCLPGDAEYRQALTTLCRRLAEVYALEATVGWEAGCWRVRFARADVAPVATRRGVGFLGGSRYGLRATAADLAAALRRCVGAHGRRQAGTDRVARGGDAGC